MYKSHKKGAISSAVERLVYTERVGGSIPSSPTTFLNRLLQFVILAFLYTATLKAHFVDRFIGRLSPQRVTASLRVFSPIQFHSQRYISTSSGPHNSAIESMKPLIESIKADKHFYLFCRPELLSDAVWVLNPEEQCFQTFLENLHCLHNVVKDLENNAAQMNASASIKRLMAAAADVQNAQHMSTHNFCGSLRMLPTRLLYEEPQHVKHYISHLMEFKVGDASITRGFYVRSTVLENLLLLERLTRGLRVTTSVNDESGVVEWLVSKIVKDEVGHFYHLSRNHIHKGWAEVLNLYRLSSPFRFNTNSIKNEQQVKMSEPAKNVVNLYSLILGEEEPFE